MRSRLEMIACATIANVTELNWTPTDLDQSAEEWDLNSAGRRGKAIRGDNVLLGVHGDHPGQFIVEGIDPIELGRGWAPYSIERSGDQQPAWADSIEVIRRAAETEASLLAVLTDRYPRAVIIEQLAIDDDIELAKRATWRARNDPGFHNSLEAVDLLDDSRPQGTPLSRRIDALMLLDGKRTAIEVKVSRQDFRSDSDEKRRPWKEFAHRFVYLTPTGLVDPSEVPAGCGLWEVDGTSLTVTKRVGYRASVPSISDEMLYELLWPFYSRIGRHSRVGSIIPRARPARD